MNDSFPDGTGPWSLGAAMKTPAGVIRVFASMMVFMALGGVCPDIR